MNKFEWLIQGGSYTLDIIVKSSTADGPLKWSNEYGGRTYSIVFANPLYLKKYKLYTKKDFRFMTEWEVIGYTGQEKKQIAFEPQNFCTKTVSNNGRKDCGENTIREFSLKNGRYIQLVINMTKTDSCNSYQMNLFGIDLYGYVTSFYWNNNSCIRFKFLSLSLHFLSILIFT